MSKYEPKLQEYFFAYYFQKLKLFNHVYSHWESSLPGFNDHGEGHINRILDRYEKLLKNVLPNPNREYIDTRDPYLNIYEIYLLLCATIWHDTGNALGRRKHEKKIKEIQRKLRDNSFVDDDIGKYAFQIAASHSGKEQIRKKIKSETVNYMDEEINLRYLAAILRFADELEEGERRIDRRFLSLDTIDESQKIYWGVSKCIKRIQPNPDEFKIEVNVSIENSDVKKLYKKDGKDISLIDEIIYRIDKMNNERMNYMMYVRKHLDYHEIILNLNIDRLKESPIIFKFNDDMNYGTFWKMHDDINPENLVPGYELRYR